jgi:hypothetical protein
MKIKIFCRCTCFFLDGLRTYLHPFICLLFVDKSLQSFCQLAINARSLAQRFQDSDLIPVKSRGVSWKDILFFLSAFLQTILKDATLSFALPVYPFSHVFQCLSVHMCQLQYHWTVSHYVWIGVLLLLSVDTLNLIKIGQHLLSLYMTLYMSFSVHSKWKIFGTQGVGKARHVF